MTRFRPTRKERRHLEKLRKNARGKLEYVRATSLLMESRHNHVKRGDMVLKYALTYAVRGAVSANAETSVKMHYLEVKQRTGIAQKAEVAAGRKLACIVWGVLKNRRSYVEEDRRLTIKKQKRTEYLAKSEIKETTPDMKELTEQVSACADTIAMYPMDLDRALGEPLSDGEELN